MNKNICFNFYYLSLVLFLFKILDFFQLHTFIFQCINICVISSIYHDCWWSDYMVQIKPVFSQFLFIWLIMIKQLILIPCVSWKDVIPTGFYIILNQVNGCALISYSLHSIVSRGILCCKLVHHLCLIFPLVLYIYIFSWIETLLVYSLYCLCLWGPSFRAFIVFPVSCPIPAFYAKVPAFYADIPCYLGFYTRYRAWYTGGSCVDRRRLQPLTWCYPDVQFNLLALPRFQVPVWFLFLQGTGEPISADHPWLGLRNGDYNASVSPPLYLWNEFFPFICHDSNELREHY